jgi:hypothetical protein
MKDNLEIWDKLKEVPKEYQKTIQNGDLKGMTDIKPQWRYKIMTEQFGAVGFGWYYDVIEKRIEEGNNQEKCGFVDINLFYKVNDEWSKPVFGTGGSSFVQFFSGKKYYKTSDEVFKMALTDALSVAMSRIGVGASVYLGENDGAKYSKPSSTPEDPALPWLNKDTDNFNNAKAAIKAGTHTVSDVRKKYAVSKEIAQLLTN